MDPRTPVIVGVGQVTNRRERIAEPMDLIVEAARRAETDAGAPVLRRVQSVQVVNMLSWSYGRPAGTLAERLGLDDGERLTTTASGSTPQWLLAKACDRIVSGELDGVLIAGAEALDSARRAAANGVQINRGDRAAAVEETVVGDTRNAVGPGEIAAGLFAPVHIYPLYESALAAEAGRSLDEQREWLGAAMAPFTRVAASHPDLSWFPVERTAGELAGVRPDNRLISEPYTKMLNAIMQVDQAAVLVLLSAEAAEAAGVPRDRWVFPWSSAESNDVFVTAERPDMTRSPAIASAGRAALQASGVSIDDVATIDLYSCFPCAVQISARALGIPFDDPRGLTVTGGLPYFGGPGNNYVSHSIAQTVNLCRANASGIGLVTANGWFVTKHAVGLYSATPPPNGWRHPSVEREQAEIDASALSVATDASGVGLVEAMTVGHDRNGPVTAPIFARLDDGRRVVASAADASMPATLSGRNLVGSKVSIRSDGGKPVYEPL